MKDLSLILKQTFVDLGCGNGLLVDLLNSEGVSFCFLCVVLKCQFN